MRLTAYIRPRLHVGDNRSIDVSTVRAADTGRYETCVFDDNRIRPAYRANPNRYSPLSEVVSQYPDAATAEIGHNAVVAALTFILEVESA